MTEADLLASYEVVLQHGHHDHGSARVHGGGGDGDDYRLHLTLSVDCSITIVEEARYQQEHRGKKLLHLSGVSLRHLHEVVLTRRQLPECTHEVAT